MKPATRLAIKPLAALLAATCALSAQAQFSSGSTGADGAFSPTVNTEVVLPPSGILELFDGEYSCWRDGNVSQKYVEHAGGDAGAKRCHDRRFDPRYWC